MKHHNILEKTFEFSVHIIKLAMQIQNARKEHVLTKQLIKAATSIGANVEEAFAGQSTADYVEKLTIAFKEARESRYWLRLISASGLADCTDYIKSVDEIMRMISSIIITTRQKNEAANSQVTCQIHSS